MTGFYM